MLSHAPIPRNVADVYRKIDLLGSEHEKNVIVSHIKNGLQQRSQHAADALQLVPVPVEAVLDVEAEPGEPRVRVPRGRIGTRCISVT